MTMRGVILDLVGLAGISMLGTGLWMLKPWLALVVVGALLTVGAIVVARVESQRGA